MKLQGLIKYSYVCIDFSHFFKQHFLEYVNIPESVNNLMWLGFSSSILFENFLHKPTTYLVNTTQINKREYDLVTSKPYH